MRMSSRRKAPVDILRTCFALAAISALLGMAGCAGAPPQDFDLHAASAHVRALRAASIYIDLPTAAPPLDSEMLVVREGGDRLTCLHGAQWADRLTLLVQNRAMQTFENAGLLGKLHVSGEAAQVRLALAIRRFDIDAPTRQARVEIAAQLVGPGGRIIAARIFSASEPIAEIAGAEPPQALDRALGRILPQLVGWAAVSS